MAIPARCIELFTFRDDVVLDPFMGSGSTAVAAVRADRRYVGYDTDPAYVALAEKRVAEAQELVDASPEPEPEGEPGVRSP